MPATSPSDDDKPDPAFVTSMTCMIPATETSSDDFTTTTSLTVQYGAVFVTTYVFRKALLDDESED